MITAKCVICGQEIIVQLNANPNSHELFVQETFDSPITIKPQPHRCWYPEKEKTKP